MKDSIAQNRRKQLSIVMESRAYMLGGKFMLLLYDTNSNISNSISNNLLVSSRSNSLSTSTESEDEKKIAVYTVYKTQPK